MLSNSARGCEVDFMTGYQIAMLCGVPSICVLILGWLVRKALAVIKKMDSDEKSVKNGVKALLRSQMITDYNHYQKKGYAPIYAKESFENCWEQYHNLGANGVMDDIKDKFLRLPTEPPKNK